MDHFLYSHYNRVSDQASYKNSCFFSFWGVGVLLGFFLCLYLVLSIIYDYFCYSYTFLKYCCEFVLFIMQE